jgi:two-component system cell cycle sensor histidine kinase/response regulator CckA
MELLGRLTSGIVHDFNNLLSVQLNNLALVQAGLPPETALEESLHALRKAINQGVALTDRLLMLVRKDSRGLHAVDLNAVCAEAAELLKNSISPRIALEVRLRPGLPSVHGDSGQLMQVLMNLCFNACDAMPRGGRLLIETESVPPAAAGGGRRMAESGTFVCLHVSDTGEGIPPEVRPRIFEPFFTTKPAGQGTGLGLSIVAEIVQRAEGWIDCSSAVGRGTRFTIWLPAIPLGLPSPSSEGEESISPPSPPRGGEGRAGGRTYAGADVTPPSRSLGQQTILLADNEPSIVLLAQTILQRHGYRVLSCADGRQALEMYRQKHAVVDLVILDQDMPGLSGLETVNELLKINSQARVLIVTGGPSPEPSWGTGTPGWGFLSKPFTAEQLVQSVRDVLAAPIINRGS